MIFSEEIDEILNVGFFLGNVGVNNWVLDKEKCLEAIHNLKNINVAIWGGDTFFDGRINPTGDSWSCNRRLNEDEVAFLERSVRESIKFVSNPIYDKFKFILVPKI